MYRVTVTYEVPEDLEPINPENQRRTINLIKKLYGITFNEQQVTCLAPLMNTYEDRIILSKIKNNGFTDIIFREEKGNQTIISFEGFDDVEINNNLNEEDDSNVTS